MSHQSSLRDEFINVKVDTTGPTDSPVQTAKANRDLQQATLNQRQMQKYKRPAVGLKSNLKMNQQFRTVTNVSQSQVVEKNDMMAYKRDSKMDKPQVPGRVDAAMSSKGKFMVHVGKNVEEMAKRRSQRQSLQLQHYNDKFSGAGLDWTPILSTAHESVSNPMSRTTKVHSSQVVDMSSILDNPVVKSAIDSSQRIDHFKKIHDQLKQQQQYQVDDELVQMKNNEASFSNEFILDSKNRKNQRIINAYSSVRSSQGNQVSTAGPYLMKRHQRNFSSNPRFFQKLQNKNDGFSAIASLQSPKNIRDYQTIRDSNHHSPLSEGFKTQSRQDRYAQAFKELYTRQQTNPVTDNYTSIFNHSQETSPQTQPGITVQVNYFNNQFNQFNQNQPNADNQTHLQQTSIDDQKDMMNSRQILPQMAHVGSQDQAPSGLMTISNLTSDYKPHEPPVNIQENQELEQKTMINQMSGISNQPMENSLYKEPVGLGFANRTHSGAFRLGNEVLAQGSNGKRLELNEKHYLNLQSHQSFSNAVSPAIRNRQLAERFGQSGTSGLFSMGSNVFKPNLFTNGPTTIDNLIATYSDNRMVPSRSRQTKSRSQSRENANTSLQKRKIEQKQSAFRQKTIKELTIHKSNGTYRHVVSHRGQNFYFKNPKNDNADNNDVKSELSKSKSPVDNEQPQTQELTPKAVQSETLSSPKGSKKSSTKRSKKTTKPIRSPTHDKEDSEELMLEQEGVQIINIKSHGEGSFNINSMRSKSSKQRVEMGTQVEKSVKYTEKGQSAMSFKDPEYALSRQATKKENYRDVRIMEEISKDDEGFSDESQLNSNYNKHEINRDIRKSDLQVRKSLKINKSKSSKHIMTSPANGAMAQGNHQSTEQGTLGLRNLHVSFDDTSPRGSKSPSSKKKGRSPKRSGTMSMLPIFKSSGKLLNLSPTQIKEDSEELVNSAVKSQGSVDFQDERRLIKEAMKRRDIGSVKITIQKNATSSQPALTPATPILKNKSGGLNAFQLEKNRSQPKIEHQEFHNQPLPSPKEDSKSVTFDLSSPEKSPNKDLDPVIDQPPLNTDRQKNDKLEKDLSVEGLKTICDVEDEQPKDNETANGTEGEHDIWRQHPDLQRLREELDAIANPSVANFKANQFLQDWFNTKLYQRIHDDRIVQFNHNLDPKLFNNISEITDILTQMHSKAAAPKADDEEFILQNFIKGICTLRVLLKQELGMSRLYEKYIYLYGQDIDLENTSKLLLRCRVLLQGRKLLSQILLLIVERNNLVNSLKQMIALDQKEIPNVSENLPVVGDGDLGDFKFDEVLAKELGETIIHYCLVIQQLIKRLKEVKSFPGFSCNSLKREDKAKDSFVFVFRGSDYVQLVRKETNEIRNCLYVYKIYL